MIGGGGGERSGNHEVKWEMQCENKKSGKYSVKNFLGGHV